MDPIKQKKRITGALYGALIGDALGVPVEFDSREYLRNNPVTGLRGGGAWMQQSGSWSDDGAQTLASAAVLTVNGVKYPLLLDAYVKWWREGFMTASGHYFDIGGATARALSRWERTRRDLKGEPLMAAAIANGNSTDDSNGNGSLMRAMPVAIWTAHRSEEAICQVAENASALTHRHETSRLACAFYSLLASKIITGNGEYAQSKIDVFLETQKAFKRVYGVDKAWLKKYPAFETILDPTFVFRNEDLISSFGYVMDSLEASIWCWVGTESYEEATLKAVNLGGDTDTTGCITGALAGLWYGVDGVPAVWRKGLCRQEMVRKAIENFADVTLAEWEIRSHDNG